MDGHGWRTWRVVWFLIVGFGPALLAQAQVVPPGVPLPPLLDPSGRSGEPPPLQKELPLPPKPSPFVVPPAPPEERREKGPVIRVFVREFRLCTVTTPVPIDDKFTCTPSTVFTKDELEAVTKPYLNGEITTDDLEALRLKLTLLYVNKGYVTSGAVVPDQAVRDGVIIIEIVEGRLSRIDIEQLERAEKGRWICKWLFCPTLRDSYLQDRIALGAGPPLNIFTIQERLQLLQQDPRIERLNAELRPGIVRGESELKVKVTEQVPWVAVLDFNNYQTPLVGAERGLATVMNRNLTGHGDPFSFTYGQSAGVIPIIDTFYTLPLTARDTTFTASYRRNDFTIVESPFDVLDITSDVEIIGLTVRHPVFKTVNEEFALSLTGEHLYNKTFLFGQGFEFVPGMKNGVGTVSALRFAQDWVKRTSSSVLAFRSRFSLGIDVLGATVNSGSEATGRFFAWLGQAQAVKRLDQWGGLQFIGRLDMQFSNERLFPLEQMFVGGRYSVRGYRENTLVRDNAFLASVEARLPVLRSAAGEDIVQLAAFSDYGRAWNTEGPTSDLRDVDYLVSVGAGLRWNILPQEKARFEIYWGQRLNPVSNPGSGGNLQDHGIHLQLVTQAIPFPW
ncbi:MAG: ShlB/FhaC/HecB family hemolysin secretion/activation protein [Nitrospiraceae bacterium]